jgi:competence protein ComEC
VVLNPIVWIPIAVALLSGFSVLLFGWLAPPIAHVFGGICNFSLGIVESIIGYAADIRWGHFWMPGPDLWWVAGFYAGLALYTGLLRRRVRIGWCVAGLALWMVVGVLAGSRRGEFFFATDGPRLECTFLAVGHGGCTVLELPDGRVMLYDAGRMGMPGRAVRAISAVLWSRGITHLESIVISHADADHFNAVPELLKRFSVGVVYVPPTMFQQNDPATVALRQAIDDAGIPIRVLHRGSRLTEVDGETISVLHPPPHGCDGGDNANSIVLRVEYGGRSIILPGDLEKQGLRDVLAEPSTPCDVLLVPHHGSTRSSPQEIAAWCTPRWAIISASLNEAGGPAEAVYRDAGATVLHNAISGAVRVRITQEEIAVRAWREQPW